MVSLAICAASSFVYDVLFLLCLCVCVFFLFLFFAATRIMPGTAFFTRHHMIPTYSSYVVFSERRVRCGLLYYVDTGVRADPKYPYIYDVICIYVREECYFRFSILIFHIYLVGAW